MGDRDQKKRFSGLSGKLEFLRPWDRDDEMGEDLEISRVHGGDGDDGQEDLTGQAAALTAAAADQRIWMAAILGLLFLATIGFYLYNRNHTFTSYVVTTARENTDIEGTQYARLGKSLIKYSSDGVFCVSLKNVTKWTHE